MSARPMRALVVVVALGAAARADTVRVKVTEVAGGVAFVDAGRKSGLVPKTIVHVRGRAFTIFEVTEKTAAFRTEGATVSIGDVGTASVTPGASTIVKQLPKPRPAESFTGQWPAPVLPSEVQDAKPVPLGNGKAPGSAHVTVIGHAYGTVDKSSHAGDGEGRVIATFDLMHERPLAADLDVAGRVFSSGYDSGTHVPIFVRALELRYGLPDDPRFAIGRLRYAATSVGMLDGARASIKFGKLEFAAWGGLVPDPLGATPTTGAARFGGEFIYDDVAAAWRPRIAVNVHGSTWQGQLDERRVSAVASAGHDAWWTNAWAELQNFDANNPFNAPTIELTGAGASVEYRKHGTYLSLDETFLRPEQSLRLYAALSGSSFVNPMPTTLATGAFGGWLCSLSGGLANQEACSGSDFWETTSVAAGIRRSSWAVDGIASVGVTHEIYRGLTSSGYLRAELFATKALRFEAGISGGQASFASWTAAEIGAGLAVSKKLDVQARYRPERLDYNASTGAFIEHQFIGDAHYAYSTKLDLVGSALVALGGDRDNVALLLTAVWRPLP